MEIRKVIIWSVVIIAILSISAYAATTSNLGNLFINGWLDMTNGQIINVANITGENGGMIIFE